MSAVAVIVRFLAGAGAVLLGSAGLLAAPLGAGVFLGSAVFSVGALAGSVTLITVAMDLVRPRWSAWLASAVAAVAGAAAGLLVTDSGRCCLYPFSIHRGFPLPWHHSEVLPDGAEVLRPELRPETDGLPASASLEDMQDGVDLLYLAADVAFWFGVVLTVVVIAGLVAGHRRRARR